MFYFCTSANREHGRHRAEHASDTFKSSELLPTAGSGRKQVHEVVRGEGHAHLLLPWRFTEIHVPGAQHCVSRRNHTCSPAQCTKDQTFSRT